MKWLPGRQGSGYRKLKFFQIGSMDCWLLHFPPGSFAPPHTDKIPNNKHYRLNLILKPGGHFTSQDSILTSRHLNIFRSDREHSVEASPGSRWVLSFGLAVTDSGALETPDDGSAW